MQKGMQPKPVTAQRPTAQALNERKEDQLWLLNERIHIEKSDSQCVSARHVPRPAERSVLACGTLDWDGGVAEGDLVIDSRMMSSLGRSDVFHCGLDVV